MLHVQGTLFDPRDEDLPEGMRYEPEFLTPDEETLLLEFVRALPLEEMRYKNYTARRRVVSFGGQYDFSAQTLKAKPDAPPELDFLQARAAEWLGRLDMFTQILIAEYSPGTPLGWHRDVPDFEDIVGVSLLSQAVLRFRPYPPRHPKKADILRVTVAPRSIYLLSGPARWAWQHSVAPTTALRYSITLRTPRRPALAAEPRSH